MLASIRFAKNVVQTKPEGIFLYLIFSYKQTKIMSLLAATRFQLANPQAKPTTARPWIMHYITFQRETRQFKWHINNQKPSWRRKLSYKLLYSSGCKGHILARESCCNLGLCPRMGMASKFGVLAAPEIRKDDLLVFLRPLMETGVVFLWFMGRYRPYFLWKWD